MPSEARAAAHAVLMAVGSRRGTLAAALASPLVERLPERDRAFAHEIVLGTLRRRGWLDHLLSPCLDRPLERQTPQVLESLRLGAYQLLFTRVPPHAAVSESVELTRAVSPRAAAFANAVLRRLQRDAPRTEPATADPLQWLITWGSLPRWLAQRWLERLGAEKAISRARALLETPPVHLRLNPRRPGVEAALARAGVRVEPACAPGALTLIEGRVQPHLESGEVYVQDVGSQAVARLAARDGRSLDACAAPGGKTLLLADLAAGRGGVVAQEASPRRVRTLRRVCARWGAAEVMVVAADARHPPFGSSSFDAVLVDAPCSGLGTLARHPDIRWRATPEALGRQSRRQAQILSETAPLVAPGGHLVYATCSVEPEENEDVVLPFLQTNPGWEVEPPPAWADGLTDGRFLRIEPGPGRGDAFFAAVLRRAT